MSRTLSGVQDGLREKLGQGEIHAEVKDAPFVQIPLGVTEDRLVGTVDIEASMKVRPSDVIPGTAKVGECLLAAAYIA